MQGAGVSQAVLMPAHRQALAMLAPGWVEMRAPAPMPVATRARVPAQTLALALTLAAVQVPATPMLIPVQMPALALIPALALTPALGLTLALALTPGQTLAPTLAPVRVPVTPMLMPVQQMPVSTRARMPPLAQAPIVPPAGPLHPVTLRPPAILAQMRLPLTASAQRRPHRQIRRRALHQPAGPPASEMKQASLLQASLLRRPRVRRSARAPRSPSRQLLRSAALLRCPSSRLGSIKER